MTKKLISIGRSGVVRLAFFKGAEEVGNGSGFLSSGFLVTNSHVIRPPGPFDAVEITFGDQDSNPITPIRYLPETLYSNIVSESPKGEFDYAILKLDEAELSRRFQFSIRHMKAEIVGEQILFFGFPFKSQHLTSHLGYISADFSENNVHIFQIDGSVNPGNSGGPLVHIASEDAIGIVTRTKTGLEEDFDDLVEAIKGNVNVLERAKGIMSTRGVDPYQATQVTMKILAKLSKNIKRSANVGIGYAFSAEHILATGLFKEE